MASTPGTGRGADMAAANEVVVPTPDGGELIARIAGGAGRADHAGGAGRADHAGGAGRADHAGGAGRADHAGGADHGGGAGGHTFVLAHGWLSDWRTWAAPARWLLAAGHRVVLYDHRGHGRSGGGTAAFTVETLAADLATLLERLDLRDVVVAGHSMGGIAAQVLALDHADVLGKRVGGLVLVSTACDPGAMSPAAAWMVERVVASAGVEHLVARPRVAALLIRAYLRGQSKAATPAWDSFRQSFLATPAVARRSYWRSLRDVDLRERLGALEIPALVVVGSADEHTPPSSSRRLVRALPGSRLVVIRGATHALPTERPRKLAELMVDFADGLVGDRPRQTSSGTP